MRATRRSDRAIAAARVALASALAAERRPDTTGRLGRARQLLGGLDALRHFTKWNSPEEREPSLRQPAARWQKRLCEEPQAEDEGRHEG